jgi:hypothetical protein
MKECFNQSANNCYGPRNLPLRKMIEKRLSVANGVVKLKGVDKVTYHHC